MASAIWLIQITMETRLTQKFDSRCQIPTIGQTLNSKMLNAEAKRRNRFGNSLDDTFKNWKINIEYSEQDNQIVIVFPNNDRYKMTPIEDKKKAFVHVITGTKVSFAVEEEQQTINLYGQTGIRD